MSTNSDIPGPGFDTHLSPLLFAQGQDRRRSARIPLTVPVRVGPPGGQATAPVAATDLSAHGLFIEADRPVRVGARFSCELDLPGGEVAYVAEAEVAYNRDRAHGRGFGVRFVVIDERSFAAISAVIARLEANLLEMGALRDSAPVGAFSSLPSQPPEVASEVQPLAAAPADEPLVPAPSSRVPRVYEDTAPIEGRKGRRRRAQADEERASAAPEVAGSDVSELPTLAPAPSDLGRFGFQPAAERTPVARLEGEASAATSGGTLVGERRGPTPSRVEDASSALSLEPLTDDEVEEPDEGADVASGWQEGARRRLLDPSRLGPILTVLGGASAIVVVAVSMWSATQAPVDLSVAPPGQQPATVEAASAARSQDGPQFAELAPGGEPAPRNPLPPLVIVEEPPPPPTAEALAKVDPALVAARAPEAASEGPAEPASAQEPAAAPAKETAAPALAKAPESAAAPARAPTAAPAKAPESAAAPAKAPTAAAADVPPAAPALAKAPESAAAPAKAPTAAAADVPPAALAKAAAARDTAASPPPAREERASKSSASVKLRLAVSPKATVKRTLVMREPDRLMIDLFGQTEAPALPRGVAGVEGMRVGRHPGFLRVVLDTRPGLVKGTVERSAKGLEIQLVFAR